MIYFRKYSSTDNFIQKQKSQLKIYTNLLLEKKCNYKQENFKSHNFHTTHSGSLSCSTEV